MIHQFSAKVASFPTRRRCGGWALADCLSVLVICACFVAFLGATSHLATEQNRRIICANNLRQVGMAALMYANSEVRTGVFPRVRFDPANPTPTAYTGVDAIDPFSSSGPKPNDVSASLYLVLKEEDINPVAFVCPGSDAEPPADAVQQHSNFPGRKYLGYSYSNPFPTQKAIDDGWKFNNTLGSVIAIVLIVVMRRRKPGGRPPPLPPRGPAFQP